MPTDQNLNRIRALRTARGMTLKQLAAATGLSDGYLSRLEAGGRNLNMPAIEKIAQAFNVSPQDVIGDGNAWQGVLTSGVVSANQEILPESEERRLTANVPSAFGQVFALRVQGNFMFPRYSDNDIILYKLAGVFSGNVMGMECVVRLGDGKYVLKFLLPGSRSGLYHLTSFNAPALIDIPLEREAIAPVFWVLRHQPPIPPN